MDYLARRNGRLVKVWKADPTATEAIDRAYFDVFGRPAPDNWREGLAEIVTAARAGAERAAPQQAESVGTIASQIAAAMLREQLAAGHRIEIPASGSRLARSRPHRSRKRASPVTEPILITVDTPARQAPAPRLILLPADQPPDRDTLVETLAAVIYNILVRRQHAKDRVQSEHAA